MNKLQEQISKFRKLSGLLSEDFGNDETLDYNRDEASKNMLFDCLKKIKEMNGNDFEKETYKEWIDSYFFNEYGSQEDFPQV